MTKIEFYTASKEGKSTSDDFDAVARLLVSFFDGFTLTTGIGVYKREPEEECYVYTVLTTKMVTLALVCLIADQIAIQFRQESVLYFVTKGEGGFS